MVVLDLWCQVVNAGGGGEGPDVITDLAHWWRADDLALANGAPIGGAGAEWVDRVAGIVASQANPALRPTYVASAINGQPTVLITIDDIPTPFALDLSASFTVPADYTLLFVMRAVGMPAASGFAAIFEGNVVDSFTVLELPGYSASTSVGAVIFYPPFAGADPAASPHCLTFRRIGAAPNNQTASLNTGQLKTDSLDGGYTIDYFFKNLFANAGTSFTLELAEVIHYSRGLSDAEILALYTDYLKPRYGLP